MKFIILKKVLALKKNKIKKEINIQFLKIPEKENINNSNVNFNIKDEVVVVRNLLGIVII